MTAPPRFSESSSYPCPMCAQDHAWCDPTDPCNERDLDKSYDEHIAFVSAAKGEPYSLAEWEQEVARLERELGDARRRLLTAHRSGYCPAGRFA